MDYTDTLWFLTATRNNYRKGTHAHTHQVKRYIRLQHDPCLSGESVVMIMLLQLDYKYLMIKITHDSELTDG